MKRHLFRSCNAYLDEVVAIASIYRHVANCVLCDEMFMHVCFCSPRRTQIHTQEVPTDEMGFVRPHSKAR